MCGCRLHDVAARVLAPSVEVLDAPLGPPGLSRRAGGLLLALRLPALAAKFPETRFRVGPQQDRQPGGGRQ